MLATYIILADIFVTTDKPWLTGIVLVIWICYVGHIFICKVVLRLVASSAFALLCHCQGRRHKCGHYGHGHSTFRRAMATNGFGGHSTFCAMYCLHGKRVSLALEVKLWDRQTPEG